MNETERLRLPYPAEGENPWYTPFEGLVNSLEGWLVAFQDDRGLLMIGGGDVAWDGASLSWSDPIDFVSPMFGRKQAVAAGAQSIADGQFLLASLSRGPTGDASATLSVAASYGVDDGLVVVCQRRGSTLYFRNGLVLESGAGCKGFAHRRLFRLRHKIAKTPGAAISERDWMSQRGRLVAVEVYSAAQPNTAGAYTLAITGAGNSLLAASFDLKTLVADTVTVLTLTGTTANRMLAKGAKLVLTATSSNGDLSATDILVGLVFEEA